jgi:divinyl protochlorophyllide a 8-vinyl-reductase
MDVHPAGRIGPNSVIRLAEALDSFESRAVTSRIFGACGVGQYLDKPPADMVDEAEVASLHREMHRAFGDSRARSVAWVAGRRTADYLLANRIPRPAQRVLKLMPAKLASRILVEAIKKNAWTFAGTGEFSATHRGGAIISIANCALCRDCHSTTPYCDYYSGVFEHLFAELVHPRAIAREIACSAMGAPKCVFAIGWREQAAPPKVIQ